MIRARDVVAIGGILLGFMGVAEWRYLHPGYSVWLETDANDHLGAEYDEIARAIRAGRGFSDPFRVESGPTAWMAPVLPYVLAGFYWIAGDDRETVIEVVLFLKYLVLLLTGLIVVFEARRIGRIGLGYLVVIVGLAAHFHAMFQRTHDEWVLLLIVDVLWLGIVRLRRPPIRTSTAVAWGMFGGFAALCAPVAGATWAIVTLVRWFPGWDDSALVAEKLVTRGRPLGLAALCSIIAIMPWMIRNRVELGRWIPIKSNCAYEIWQSQCVDDDGVLDHMTFASHPWASPGEQRSEYAEKGEIQFIDVRWPETWRSIRDAPDELMRRIFNRFSAACLWHDNSDRELQEWGGIVQLTRIAYALPFASVVAILLLQRRPIENQVAASLWIYCVFLCPYVIISYYERYGMPLIGVKMLVVLYGFDSVSRSVARPWRRSDEKEDLIQLRRVSAKSIKGASRSANER